MITYENSFQNTFVVASVGADRDAYLKEFLANINPQVPICHINMDVAGRLDMGKDRVDFRHMSLFNLLQYTQSAYASALRQKVLQAVDHTNQCNGVCIFEGFDEHVETEPLIADFVSAADKWLVIAQIYGPYSPQYLHGIKEKAQRHISLLKK